MLALLGAELVLTPGPAGHEGRRRQGARKCASEIPDAVIPQQFENPANPEIHRSTTAEEIWNDTDGRGRHASSPASAPAARSPASARSSSRASRTCKIVAVEPEDSPVLSGGQPGPHKIQGIGAGFVPDILDRSVIDEVITVGNQTAFDTARLLARLEGIPGGISSGANVAAALEVARASREQGQEHRHRRAVLRRALSFDRPVRRALRSSFHRACEGRPLGRPLLFALSGQA